MSTLTSRLAQAAHLDPRTDGYGFVWFDAPEGAEHSVRIGYCAPPLPEHGDLWQANWGMGWAPHFQAAANLLIAEGLVVPRDGAITIKMAGWDWPREVNPNRIDADITVRWHGAGAKRTGEFVLA
jgi:hypothetical protein